MSDLRTLVQMLGCGAREDDEYDQSHGFRTVRESRRLAALRLNAFGRQSQ